MNIRQIVLLFVVGVAAIWSGYTGYNRFLVPEAKAASTQNQTATVTRGSLQAQVSVSGSATITRQSKLSFGSAGILGQVSVKMGDEIKAGQVLASLDPSTIATLQNAVTQAEATLNIAKMDLETAQNPYTASDLSAAQRSVQQTQANLDVAGQDLEDVRNPYSDLDLSLAESAVQSATVTLENAKRNLGLAENDPTNNASIRQLEYEASFYENSYGKTLSRFQEGAVGQDKLDLDYGNLLTAKEKLTAAREKKEISLASARDGVAKAQDILAKAQDDLSKKKAGADPKAVQKQQSAVMSAETALQKARDDLATKQAGPDARNVEKMRNQVVSAEAAVNTAREKLKGATLVAPFDGVAGSVGINVGEQVGASTVILSLLDPQALRIDMNVAESDVSSLRRGQTASVTFDALSGQTFQARVDSISPSAKMQQGVVNYPVALTLDRASGIKEGMTATAQIVTQQKDNILLVPNRAIRTQGRTRTAQVLLPNGTTETQTIQTGMSGDQTTEVTSGLQEGDRVVIPTTTTTSRGVPGGLTGGLTGGAPGGGTFMMPPTSKP